MVHERLRTLGPLVDFVPTQGAFYVLLRLPPVAGPAGVQPRDDRALQGRDDSRLRLRAGSAPGNHQRLSFGASIPSAVTEGVDRFVAAAKALYRPAAL